MTDKDVFELFGRIFRRRGRLSAQTRLVDEPESTVAAWKLPLRPDERAILETSNTTGRTALTTQRLLLEGAAGNTAEVDLDAILAVRPAGLGQVRKEQVDGLLVDLDDGRSLTFPVEAGKALLGLQSVLLNVVTRNARSRAGGGDSPMR